MKTATWTPVGGVMLALLLSACSDGLTDINVNPNEPINVTADYLLPSAILATGGRLTGDGLNMDLTGLWVQHYAEHRYTVEDRFEITDGTINGHWSYFYTTPLEDLQEVIALGTEAGRPNVVAMGSIMKQLTMQVVTDLFGDVGYSQALQGRDRTAGNTVAYDAQKDIYDGILAELTKASASIVTGGVTITTGDLLYGGNMDRWRRFANSVRLRVAMRLSQADAAKARSEAAAAVGAGVMTSNTDNARIQYLNDGVSVHPIFAYERSRDDHSISATLVDTLKSLSDPRLPIYARPNGAGAYNGTKNGSLIDPVLSTVSRIGTYFAKADAQSVLMSYAEVLLLQAEAAERGWITANAGDLYRQAITAAMSQIGVSTADITTYLAQPKVQYAGGTAGLQQIALQKWIALFGNGPEAYAEWRRTGVPKLVAGPDALNGGRIPIRLPYPDVERSLNAAAREEAIARQGGASLNDPVWWDK